MVLMHFKRSDYTVNMRSHWILKKHVKYDNLYRSKGSELEFHLKHLFQCDDVLHDRLIGS